MRYHVLSLWILVVLLITPLFTINVLGATPSFQGAIFSVGEKADRQITVPIGTQVDVYVILSSSTSISGTVKIQIRKDLSMSIDKIKTTLAKSITIKGTQNFLVGSFIASDYAENFWSYYLRVYWNDKEIYDPSGRYTREWVKTTSTNNPPIAYIDTISPDSTTQDQTVSFSGHGIDQDGYIAAYNWRSNINGQLSTSASFSTSSLSPGSHAVYFKVQDNLGIWSTEDMKNLIIQADNPPVLSNGHIEPITGTIANTYTYFVSYSDPEGVPPTIRKVWIDDVPHEMDLFEGSASMGTYRCQMELSIGDHDYYFEFSDGRNKITLPQSGTNIGPIVTSPAPEPSPINPPSEVTPHEETTHQEELKESEPPAETVSIKPLSSQVIGIPIQTLILLVLVLTVISIAGITVRILYSKSKENGGTDTSVKICNYCGHQNPPYIENYCTKCGKPI